MLAQIKQSFINLIFPPLCLHCKGLTAAPNELLCQNCLKTLTLLNPSEYCPHCLSADYHPINKLCAACLREPPIFDGVAAAFDYQGPAASLVRQLKYGQQRYLAKGCAAYMSAQFLNLDWPIPDLIVPVPITSTKLFLRGFNQSLLIAQELGSLLQCNVKSLLKRKHSGFSQAGLSRQQRLTLASENFYLSANADIKDKIVLLVDDVMTTGSTLHCCGEALSTSFPSKLYGMVCCYTSH